MRARSVLVGVLTLMSASTSASTDAWAGPPPSKPPKSERPTPPPPPHLLPGQGMPIREPEAPTGEGFAGLGLEPQADGSWRYVDPTGHFTARFEPDGSVKFADRWMRPDASDSQNGKCCALPPPAPSIGGGMAMGGPTEWMYRLLGEDVMARKKAELLRLTLDVRLGLAVEHMQRLIDDALAQLVADLDAIRRDPTLDAAGKKQRVFEVWDDCDERIAQLGDTTPSEAESVVDEARLDAAWTARRTIEAWIRLHLPEGSARGYTAKEIARLDGERLSHEHFDPYTEQPELRPAPEPAPAITEAATTEAAITEP
ncbi:hypothetical protein ACNOYE_32425 [Nannocystaceae bacterium ST9]